MQNEAPPGKILNRYEKRLDFLLNLKFPFQNHYTHKIIIFKFFRSLQLQFLGPTGINFRYSYSFVGLTGIFFYSYSSVQLH